MISLGRFRSWQVFVAVVTFQSVFSAETAYAADVPTALAASNEALADEVRAINGVREYRAAFEKLDELLARPGASYNPVQHAWLAMHYGDYRRATSVLLPVLAKKNEFALLMHPSFEPLIAGNLAYCMGDLDRAVVLLQKAVDQIDLTSNADGFPLFVALQSLDLLGQVHRERGEHRAAAQDIQKLRGLYRVRGFPNEYLVLADLHQAELHLAKGKTSEAASSLKSIERYLEAEYKLPRVVRARILVNMGVVATRRSEWREAERLYKEALAIEEAVYADFHPTIIGTLRHLTNLYVAMGKSHDALGYASRAALLADKHARHLLSIGSERQKRISARYLEHDADTVVSLHMQYAPTDITAARLAMTTILRRKGMVFEAMIGGISSLRRNLDAEGRALAKELADLSAQMSTMISRGPVDVTLEDYQNDLFDFEEKRRSLEERLVAHANRGRKSSIDDAPLVELAEVQQNIPDGAALVELFEYHPHHPFGPPVHSTWGKSRFAAYVLHKTGDVAWVDLGQTAPITETALKLIAELSTNGQHRTLARDLDKLVTQPLRQLLDKTRWVMLSPDGALDFVPFYALVDENDRELVDTMSITYLMTGRDLLRQGQSTTIPKQDPLIVANPDFGKTIETETNEQTLASSRGADLSRIRFSQLAGTEVEGREVQKTLTNAKLLDGSAATEEALKALHGPRILHIATHGFFLPDITNVTGIDAKTNPDPWNANPLLRSGLALVGANRRKSQSDNEDGVLTALEVANLDLQGTRLVVLSACETGVGEAFHGEGVYGLQRAMMIAGAETQVTSLWQVDDNATKNLMVAFYEELAKGTSRGEAMRLAQLSVRRQYAHPYYWASFVVTGNAATLDGKNLAPDPNMFRIGPGSRGCGCRIEETEHSSGVPLFLIFAAMVARKRRRLH